MNAQDRALETDQDPVEDFQVLSHASVQMSDTPSVSIPLPLDVPPPPNLASLPAHILHSGTVETLIGQNEDLMARLKVNIRRNSILEQQIMEQDRLHARLKNEHASLIAQYQVLEEKAEMIRERSQTFDAQAEEMREQIEISMIRAESAEERSAELRAGLSFEKSYRRRIRAWVRPYIDALKNRLAESETRIAFLDRQLATREAVIGDLRERLNQADQRAQSATVKHGADQALLVETYEARIQAAESEMTKARAEANLLREKALRLDEAVSARTQAENRIVTLERKNSDMERSLTGELKTIEERLAQFRREAKELAAEAMTANAERDRARNSEVEAIAELQRTRDQFESLQAVWAEAQKKFEASKLQQDALNKLNQELSRQLKSERKARESGGSTSATTPATPLGETDPTMPPTAKESTSVRLEKIDSILAELESGYAKARGLELDADIDFVEDAAPMHAEARQAPAAQASDASL